MEGLAKALLVVAAVLALVAAGLLLASKLGLERLPGDVRIERGNFSFYAPIGLMILLSVIGTILINVFWRD
jgi:Protein of unknown function (DUF2905)